MCSSARAGPDNCTITTNNETLYIEVLAYDALNSVILTIKGRNVAKVSEIMEPEMTTKTIRKLFLIFEH